MPDTIHRPSGLRLSLPDGLTLAPDAPARPQRRPGARSTGVVPMPAAEAPAEAAQARAVADALASQDMVLVDTLVLGPAPVRPGATRAPAAAGTRDVTVDVDLDASENAVVLVEQDGVYAWQFDRVDAPASDTGAMLGR